MEEGQPSSADRAISAEQGRNTASSPKRGETLDDTLQRIVLRTSAVLTCRRKASQFGCIALCLHFEVPHSSLQGIVLGLQLHQLGGLGSVSVLYCIQQHPPSVR